MPEFTWRHFATRPLDWWNPPPPGPFEREQLELVQRLLAEAQPNRILEIGVGRGRSTEWLQGPWSYVGLEVNQGFLRKAAMRFPLAFVLASGTHLPFRDGSFQSVVAFDVFMHIWERDQFLTECRRVLEPEGILLFNFLQRYSRGWRSYQLARIVRPRAMFRVRDRRYDRTGSVQKALTRHGFSPTLFMLDSSVPIVVARRGR